MKVIIFFLPECSVFAPPPPNWERITHGKVKQYKKDPFGSREARSGEAPVGLLSQSQEAELGRDTCSQRGLSQSWPLACEKLGNSKGAEPGKGLYCCWEVQLGSLSGSLQGSTSFLSWQAQPLAPGSAWAHSGAALAAAGLSGLPRPPTPSTPLRPGSPVKFPY